MSSTFAALEKTLGGTLNIYIDHLEVRDVEKTIVCATGLSPLKPNERTFSL